MRLLMLHVDERVLTDLAESITGTGDYQIEAYTDKDAALAALSESPCDLAILWLESFLRNGGIAELRKFLSDLGDTPSALIVPTRMKTLADKDNLGVVPHGGWWVLDDPTPQAIQERVAAYASRREKDQPRSAISQQPSAVSQARPLSAMPQRIGQAASMGQSKRATATVKPAPRVPMGQVSSRIGQPSPRNLAETGGIARLGVWSASGGAGVTTIACALAALSARALVGLSEPGVSLALGLTAAAPWKALSVQGYKAVYLAPSRYERALEVPKEIASLSNVIYDLPTGPDGLAFTSNLDCLFVVLLPDRDSVTRNVHALAGRQIKDVRIAWNRVVGDDLVGLASALSFMQTIPAIVGALSDERGAREARNRAQSIPHAAEDGLALGSLPAQLRVLCYSLYPELAPREPTDGSTRRLLPRLEIVHD